MNRSLLLIHFVFFFRFLCWLIAKYIHEFAELVYSITPYDIKS